MAVGCVTSARACMAAAAWVTAQLTSAVVRPATGGATASRRSTSASPNRVGAAHATTASTDTRVCANRVRKGDAAAYG